MSTNVGFGYAIAAAVTWGLVYTIDQRILIKLSPFPLLFINSVITGLLLLPFFLLERDLSVSLGAISGRVWLFIVASLVLAALANFFIFSSIKILGAAPASTFEIAYPFFVTFFSFLAFRNTPTIYFLTGAALIFAGAAIIIMKA